MAEGVIDLSDLENSSVYPLQVRPHDPKNVSALQGHAPNPGRNRHDEVTRL
jgi:hypothetical protein